MTAPVETFVERPENTVVSPTSPIQHNATDLISSDPSNPVAVESFDVTSSSQPFFTDPEGIINTTEGQNAPVNFMTDGSNLTDASLVFNSSLETKLTIRPDNTGTETSGGNDDTRSDTVFDEDD